ncbi:MAG: molybdate ABC transporter substrate-binding protein [Jatrophihabitantaceae bacterium]
MKKLVALLLIAVLVAVAGCSSSAKKTNSTGSLSGSITVYAASSLTGAFNTLATQFEAAHPGTKITFSYAASGALATQITQGAPADVFASAAPKNMATVVSAGDASNPVNFVKNTGEIAAAPGNPAHIASVADLAKAGVKVANCEPTVPCGVVAAAVFKNANVTVKPTASEADVKSTLAVVESGEVDAGIVYVTDVRAAGSKVVGIEIPAAQNATTEYPIAPLKGSKNAALAKAFVDYVTSSDGQKVLSAAGFLAP